MAATIPGTRVEYTATEITNPVPTKNYVHAPNRQPPMNVGVLGQRRRGSPSGRRLPKRGHDVMIGTRDPEQRGAPGLARRRAAPASRAGSLADVAEFGELLVIAVLGNAAEDAIAPAGPERFAGKVVIDATNPLDFSEGPPPRLAITGHDSLGERIQRAIPDAKVVKAFNTIGNAYFDDPSFAEGQADNVHRRRRRGREGDRRTRCSRASAGLRPSTSAGSRARGSSKRCASSGSRSGSAAAPGTTASSCWSAMGQA